MSTATVSPSPNAALARLREVFESQRETALRLRTSGAAERIAKLKKLRDAIIAYTDTWYAAGQAVEMSSEEAAALQSLGVLGEEIKDKATK